MEPSPLNRALPNVTLRPVSKDDLPIFFAQQLDAEANRMAAFTALDPTDEDAFRAKWERILSGERLVARTILLDRSVAGHIVRYDLFGEPQVSYWIGKDFWGQGVATRALALFLEIAEERPLYGREAQDNAGSMRVLQKNGFTIDRQETGFANARGMDVVEFVLKLD